MPEQSNKALVYFPGGFGTLDEMFEIVTLIQTKKIATHIPVILVGRSYWEPLLKWVVDDVYGKFSAIDKEDVQIFNLVDSAEEAMEIIHRSKPRNEFN
jgi:predicted Rossmann-fold nucleotide-binding protein